MSVQTFSCEVAILAGGMGTRLRARTGALPKPMAMLLGKPVLEHQITLCREHGFTRIALLVHYESEIIKNHFGDGSEYGVEITYCIEQEARGTAGALSDALPWLADCFLVLYGDTYADVNLRKLWQAHLNFGSDGTLLLHPNDHPQDSDLVEVDRSGLITKIHPYPHAEGASYRNLVNAALYVLNKGALDNAIPPLGKFDLAKHTFPEVLALGRRLNAYISPEYIKDMGTPDRLDKVVKDIVTGLPERLSDRHTRRAVFLDRDGTLNVEVNHLSAPDQLQLLPNAAEAIHRLNRAGILAICVTNQPVVARGEVTIDELEKIHGRLDQLLAEGKSYLDRLYFCPHHPDSGFEGEIKELKIDCECRKPQSGMIEQAVKELTISRQKSWMVGDTTSDIEAGRRAGLRTILVRTGYAGLDGKHQVRPDYIVPNVDAAVDWILHGHMAILKQLLSICGEAMTGRMALIGGVARSGKSSVARVMAELIEFTGKTVHVISLDGWLRPEHERMEGVGVLSRYDMEAVMNSLLPILDDRRGRHWLEIPEHERKSRTIRSSGKHSIGPDDFVIIEGVTALFDSPLLEYADVKIFVDVNDEERSRRLGDEYAWRGESKESVAERIAAREIDEVPAVRATASNATHFVTT